MRDETWIGPSSISVFQFLSSRSLRFRPNFPSSTMNARTALVIMVGLTVVVALVRFFEQNWILGATAAMVVVGTAFIAASMYLSDRDERPTTLQSASKLRAIGLIVIGIGTLFGALMLIV